MKIARFVLMAFVTSSCANPASPSPTPPKRCSPETSLDSYELRETDNGVQATFYAREELVGLKVYFVLYGFPEGDPWPKTKVNEVEVVVEKGYNRALMPLFNLTYAWDAILICGHGKEKWNEGDYNHTNQFDGVPHEQE